MTTMTARTAYLCPQGHMRTDRPGICPEHGVPLERATYRCPNCGYATLQAGDCPLCHTHLAPDWESTELGRRTTRGNGSIVGHVIKGAAAGALGTVVMEQVTSWLYEHENPRAREAYERVTQGKYVPERTAERIEGSLGLTLSDSQRQRLAQASHWVVGLAAGATYAVLRQRVRGADRGQGLLFGLAFWALFDEVFTVLMGVAEPPQKYPWQAHALGLAGHVAYGVVADTTLDVLDRVA